MHKQAKHQSVFKYFFDRFFKYLAPSGAKYCEKGRGRYKNWLGLIDKPILALLTFGQTHFEAVNFVNAGFWRLRAPETSIWAPEGAFGRIFSYIWPLAGPNIGFIGVWKAASCLNPTGREGCVGLRRENFGFPESRILKPSFS